MVDKFTNTQPFPSFLARFQTQEDLENFILLTISKNFDLKMKEVILEKAAIQEDDFSEEAFEAQ